MSRNAPFKFTLGDFGYNEINLVKLPRSITFQVHAFAVDTVGNCGANVTGTLATLPCDSIMPPLVPAGQKWFIAKNAAGLSQLVTVVPGFSRTLPTPGAVIADLLVDTVPGRNRMYLSNLSNNRVEVLCIVACGTAADSSFAPAISVGSEPWGLFLNNAAVGIGPAGAPRLMVANSGGTNISFVDISGATPPAAEVPSERVLTPNEVLIDVAIGVANGLTRYTVQAHDFSDRPQFVGEDANGIVLYSTKPTAAAPDGTVRELLPTSPRRESNILFNRSAIMASTDGVAVAYVDSIIVERNSTSSDLVSVCDHKAGSSLNADAYCTAYLDLRSALDQVRLGKDGVAGTADDSDEQDYGGTWNLEAVGLSDTTFITTSGNRQYVGFGEGATGPFASVWLWHCGPQTAACGNGDPSSVSGGLSDNESTQDLIGNAAERVLGIALNQDGSIGAARGANSAYFFSQNVQAEGSLRLQGLFSSGVAGGNGGIALHPHHNYDLTNGSNANTLAFVATVNRSIKIVDTFHFRERGEIQIRDNIVGPLRAAPPIASENAGPDGIVGTGDDLQQPGPDGIRGTADDVLACDAIWVKLYGVTGAGKAVIINVRAKDITNPIITSGVCPQ